jgi:hypothetical protein
MQILVPGLPARMRTPNKGLKHIKRGLVSNTSLSSYSIPTAIQPRVLKALTLSSDFQLRPYDFHAVSSEDSLNFIRRRHASQSAHFQKKSFHIACWLVGDQHSALPFAEMSIGMRNSPGCEKRIPRSQRESLIADLRDSCRLLCAAFSMLSDD